MSENKPREFWLKQWKDDKLNFHQTEFCKVDPKTLFGVDCEDFKNAVHVIEYTAYENLKSKLESAMEQIYAAEIALKEMFYQAKRTYGTEEKILSDPVFPWELVMQTLAQLEEWRKNK